MRFSKLKACLAVLQVVTKKERTTLEDIVSHTKIERSQVESSLDLLMKNQLILKFTNLNNSISYTSTERGHKILSFFGINEIFSVQ